MAKQAQPECLAILLCDQVIEDKTTNKKSVIGMFNQIGVRKVPGVQNLMALMISLTDMQGKHKVGFTISHDTPEGTKELTKVEGDVQIDDRLAVVDMVFNLRGFKLPTLGKYTITALANGAPLAMRHFQVVQAPPGA